MTIKECRTVESATQSKKKEIATEHKSKKEQEEEKRGGACGLDKWWQDYS